MLKEQPPEDELQSDLENARHCSQPSCHRVADHCSSLLDAVLIFKTWFIQRQGELAPNHHQQQSIADTDPRSVVPFDQSNGDVSRSRPLSTTAGPVESSSAMDTANAMVLRERDWAVTRMRRMENQVNRLRTACLAMRVQLEAGLRHKAEADQVKRELEMTHKTVAHYENIISEGNRLREDLRTELARVRKELSITRSRVQPARSSIGGHPTPGRVRDWSLDSTARLDSFGDAHSSSGELHALLDRQTKWLETMNAETKELRETLRTLSEKDTEKAKLIDALRSVIRDAMNRISALGHKRRTSAPNPFGCILNFHWLSTLASQLQVTIPENLADIAVEYSSKQSDTVPVTELAPLALPSSRKRKAQPDVHKAMQKLPKKIPKKEGPSPTKVDLDEFMDSQSSASSDVESPPSSAMPGSRLLEHVISELNHFEGSPTPVPTEPVPGANSASDWEESTIGSPSPQSSTTSPRTRRNGRSNRLASYSPVVHPTSNEVQDLNITSPSSPAKTRTLRSSKLNTNVKPPSYASLEGKNKRNEAASTEVLPLPTPQVSGGDSGFGSTSTTALIPSSPLEKPTPEQAPKPRTRRKTRNGSNNQPLIRQLSESSEEAVAASSPLHVSQPSEGNDAHNTVDVIPLGSHELQPASSHPLTTTSTNQLSTVEESPKDDAVVLSSVSQKFPTSPKTTDPTVSAPSSSKLSLFAPQTTAVLRPPASSGPKRPVVRSTSSTICADESVATRVITCPTGYNRRGRATVQRSTAAESEAQECDNSTDITLLSLLKSAYSPNTIDWFDRVTSDTILQESVHTPTVSERLPPLNLSISNNMLLSLRTPVVSNTAQRPPEDVDFSLMAADLLAVESVLHPEPTPATLDTTLKAACIDYLRSSPNTQSLAILIQQLVQSPGSNSLDVLWSSFLELLQSNISAELEMSQTNFVNLCLAMKAQITVQQVSEWLLSHTDNFHSSIQAALAVKCVYRIFVADQNTHYSRMYLARILQNFSTTKHDQFLLCSLPYIVDACHILFKQLWPGLEPMRDAVALQFYQPVADPQSFSFLIATIQALLAWQEARVMRSETMSKQNKGKQMSDIYGIFNRLHSYGWLPGQKSSGTQPSVSVTSLALSQQTHRLRCLALRLVDGCLQIQRNEIGNTITVKNAELTPERHEAAWSLTLLLSAMTFVVGEEAIIDNEDDVPGSGSELAVISGSTSTHQRKRRNRQTHRQQRQGLLGWLLSGRLLPWLTKQTKLLHPVSTTDAQRLFGALILLTTDVAILGSKLFAARTVLPDRRQLPNSPTEELRSTVFACGRRVLALLERIDPQPSLTSCICAAVRLIGFAPQRAMKVVLRFCRDVPSQTVMQTSATSILWPPCPLSSLFSQSLTLLAGAPHLPQTTVSSYTQTCKLYMTNSLN